MILHEGECKWVGLSWQNDVLLFLGCTLGGLLGQNMADAFTNIAIDKAIMARMETGCPTSRLYLWSSSAFL